MRSRGDVRCVLGGVSYEVLLEAPNGMTFSPPEDLRELGSAGMNAQGTLRVSWEVDLRFFNQKDEPTGLHAISLAFVDGEGDDAVVGPLRKGVSGRTRQLRSPLAEGPPQDMLDLPSQQWALKRISAKTRGADGLTSLRWERIEVRAEYPNGKPYVKEIDHRQKVISTREHEA